MKKQLAVLLTLLAVTAAAEPMSEKDAIRQRMHEACEAYRTGDADYLENVLAEGYTLTSTRGVVTSREQDLAEVRSGDPHFEEFRNHHMKIRFYGDTAVVNGITSLKGTYRGKAFEFDAQFTDTLVKQNGMWMLAASHATRIEDQARPLAKKGV